MDRTPKSKGLNMQILSVKVGGVIKCIGKEEDWGFGEKSSANAGFTGA